VYKREPEDFFLAVASRQPSPLVLFVRGCGWRGCGRHDEPPGRGQDTPVDAGNTTLVQETQGNVGLGQRYSEVIDFRLVESINRK
jgi:hypothetical protein